MTDPAAHQTYPTVPARPSLPELERAVLEFWDRDRTFQESVKRRSAGEHGCNEYVFYDGPPFANGLPHYGHLLTGYVKDVVPRYQTMRGKRVERRFGWDTHGLPVEVEAERQLGITHKSEIEELGIAEFNEACRTSVMRYATEWREYVRRQARWVDFDNDYKTLDLPYMESVIWAFKQLWEKGLVYSGFRVLWYCWRCETPLAATETRMDDVYGTRHDPAVTVGLRLLSRSEEADLPAPLEGALALIWTTTPWTLPANLALAVHPEVEYVVVEVDGVRFVLAEARLSDYAREFGERPSIVARLTGSALVGLGYMPPFSFFAGRANAHRILAAEFVSTDEGTGIVHIAPGFGEEDQELTDRAGIEVVVPVDAHGRFTAEIGPYAGLHVFDANDAITQDLRDGVGYAEGVLVREETYEHPYPHCWRCGNPLIQRAVDSWFMRVTAIRERLLELGQQVRWVPMNVGDGQFGRWLQGARDWNISRNRFWGAPIPVWRSDDPEYPRTDVYGSLDDLERDFGVRLSDLHRPAVDRLTRPNPDDPSGRSLMRRVPEVLDCWFESGAMPFAQVHYPFENKDWFEHHYPGDFIVEYAAQTRGWFYTLHVLGTALFDRPAFSNCSAHGIVLGSDGQKMSKSRLNYPDVGAVFERDGADAMRWFLLSSAILRGGNLSVTEQGIRDATRQAILPLWNTWYFLTLYANSAGGRGRWRTDSTHALDRYLLARTATLLGGLAEAIDALDIARACEQVRDHLDALTNWYVRRSRPRFWEGDRDAIDTLHTALEILLRGIAPLLPLLAETIWKDLTGQRSVHLSDWPSGEDLVHDPAIETAMERVREVASAALALRKARGLRVRLPLAKLTVATADAAALEPFAEILRDEVNVKQLVLTDDAARHARVELVVDARAIGPRLGADTQDVIRAIKAGDWAYGRDGGVRAAGIQLCPGEYTERMVAIDPENTIALHRNFGVVVLDLDVTPELAREGLARDVIRVVQQARRDAGLEISDRIALTLQGDEAVADAVRAHEPLIVGEVLACSLTLGAVTNPAFTGTITGGARLTVQIDRR